MADFEDYTVEIQKAAPATWLERLKDWGRLIWTLPQRIYTTYLLIRFQEFREPALRSVCPMRFLNPFRYLQFNAKIVTKSAVMKAILRYARKDPNGLFWDRDNAAVFFPILRDLYPEETITEEDFIFTCSQENLRKFRQPILGFVGPNSIDKRKRELEHVIDEVLRFYTNEEKEQKINGTKFSQVLPVAIVSRLLLGHQGPMLVYQQIADAVDLINRCMMKRMLKQPRTQEEQEGYSAAVSILRSAIDTSYLTQEEGSFITSLKESMTPLQAKLSLYIMYFAGSDTTGSVLTYLLWQLGRHPEIQDEIYREMRASNEDLFTFANQSLAIHQVLSESLRLFCSAYVIGRIPITSLNCMIKDKAGRRPLNMHKLRVRNE